MPNQKAKVETDRDAKSLYEGSLGELLKVLTEEPSFRLTNCGQDLGDEGHKSYRGEKQNWIQMGRQADKWPSGPNGRMGQEIAI